MNLPEASIREFIQIYKSEYGVAPSYEEAEEMATELLNLYNNLI